MNGSGLQAFLARIYVDRDARERFLLDPSGEARRAGLRDEDACALEHVDRVGLVLAAQSFELKRARKGRSRIRRRWIGH